MTPVSAGTHLICICMCVCLHACVWIYSCSDPTDVSLGIQRGGWVCIEVACVLGHLIIDLGFIQEVIIGWDASFLLLPAFPVMACFVCEYSRSHTYFLDIFLCYSLRAWLKRKTKLQLISVEKQVASMAVNHIIILELCSCLKPEAEI